MRHRPGKPGTQAGQLQQGRPPDLAGDVRRRDGVAGERAGAVGAYSRFRRGGHGVDRYEKTPHRRSREGQRVQQSMICADDLSDPTSRVAYTHAPRAGLTTTGGLATGGLATAATRVRIRRHRNRAFFTG